MSNTPLPLVNKLKDLYKEFLWDSLKATLSEEKKLIIDMRKKPAHFLGFGRVE
jgi:hypothetical protein